MAGLVLSVLSTVAQKTCSDSKTFEQTYKHTIEQIQLYLLRPLFFASIGYAIPVRSLFTGRILWQGVCYTLVGIFSKLVCGIFVILSHTFTRWRRSKARRPGTSSFGEDTSSTLVKGVHPARPVTTFPPKKASNKPSTPSLLPVSALLGSAMVARGEISLLILNLAREASPELMPDRLFYIAIWATLLCTIVGPLTVGITVKRMKHSDKALPAEWGPVAKPQTPSVVDIDNRSTGSSDTASHTADPIRAAAKGQKPKDTITSPPIAHRVF